jgi:hypothetical protein
LYEYITFDELVPINRDEFIISPPLWGFIRNGRSVLLEEEVAIRIDGLPPVLL